MQQYKSKYDGVMIKKAVITYAKEYHTFNHRLTLEYLIKNSKEMIKFFEAEKKRFQSTLNDIDQGSLFDKE